MLLIVLAVVDLLATWAAEMFHHLRQRLFGQLVLLCGCCSGGGRLTSERRLELVRPHRICGRLPRQVLLLLALVHRCGKLVIGCNVMQRRRR